MNRRLGASVLATLLLTALQARALEILSDSERAERERDRKLKAKPVLSCKPARFSTKAKRGDTAELLLTIRNAGGRTLRWSFGKLPRWLAPNVTSGELKHAEEKRVVLHVRTRLVSGGGDESGITIVAPGADGSPLTVPIAVAVEEPPPEPAPVRPKPIVRAPDPGRRPRRERDRLPPEPGGGGRGKVAARLGFMLPGDGDKMAFDSTPFFGVQYRLPRREESKLSYEIGVDLASSDADADVGVTSKLLTGRADVLFHMGGENGGAWYLLSGLGGMIDNADLDGVSDSYMVGLLDLGAGIGLVGGKLDLRLSRSILLGSENVGGMTQISVAYNF